jgi:hypothetical protein
LGIKPCAGVYAWPSLGTFQVPQGCRNAVILSRSIRSQGCGM